jgi:broad specificity polyphosphatase/5'/3'-nucleotidase SurE
VAAEVAKVFVAGVLADPPESPVVVNLNVPNCDLSEIAGWEIAEVGVRPPRAIESGSLVPTDRPDTFGVQLTWGEAIELPAHTDGGAIERDLVTITYLSHRAAGPGGV